MTPVAFVLKGYPRLSETFIAQEILALEQRGLDIRIVSLRHPTDPDTHPVHHDIEAPVSYLPEYLHEEPPRVLTAWWHVRHFAGYTKAWKVWMADLRRDFSRNRIRRFGQACVLAHELPEDVHHLHAHFLHTPASVTRYAAMMRNLPWSCSAHAKDIYTSPDWEISEKLSDCRWLVTCTRANMAHLKLLAANPSVISCTYHGLDLTRFPASPAHRELRDGKTEHSPARLLSVGRAVEKKGYDGLLDALAALPRDIHWRFTHLGGGPELARLQKKAAALNLSDRIDWLGPQSQTRVLEEYRQADIFVLNSRIADDGDRDGLPNVLMEAQSQGLACVASAVSAIPELIIDEETGYLTPPDDPTAMAELLEHVIRNPADRARIAATGERRIRSEFALNNTIRTLAQQFGLAPDSTDTDSTNNSPGGET